jgi:hypothetical protein
MTSNDDLNNENLTISDITNSSWPAGQRFRPVDPETDTTPAKYDHQPDFRTLTIADKPDNGNADSTVTVTAGCVCGHAGGWAATVQPGTWIQAGHSR